VKLAEAVAAHCWDFTSVSSRLTAERPGSALTLRPLTHAGEIVTINLMPDSGTSFSCRCIIIIINIRLISK